MKIAVLAALISLVSGVVGAAIGAFVVHWLTRSRDRENWLRDQKLHEWRELLSSLEACHVAFIRFGRKSIGPHPPDSELINDAIGIAARVLSDRIFIASEVQKLNFVARFKTIANAFRQNRDEERLDAEVELIRAQIVSEALKVK